MSEHDQHGHDCCHAPAFAAAVMSLGSVSVIGNALRLRSVRL